MSIVKDWQESQKGAALFGTIRCPRNYILKPGCNPFKIIPNPRFKHTSQKDIDYLNDKYNTKIKKWIYSRDKHGNKIQDFNSYYQPSVSKAYVVEHIYDPMDQICRMQCRGSCLRGLGSINTHTIKRLNK